jgi:hypothetical protein
VAQKVASGVYKGVTTSELDELAAETAASMTSKHPDYAQVRRTRPSPALSGSLWHEKTSAFRGSTLSSRMLLFPNVRDADRPALTSPQPPPPQLAARIAVSNLHKNTKKSFSETYVPRPSARRAFPASLPTRFRPGSFPNVGFAGVCVARF